MVLLKSSPAARVRKINGAAGVDGVLPVKLPAEILGRLFGGGSGLRGSWPWRLR